MPRGKSPNTAAASTETARREMSPAAPSAELQDRLNQARLLRDPRVRAMWPHLKPDQQEAVHDPDGGRRYPLSSGDVARLTSLSERQVRYWADHGLIPNWRKGNRRHFEAVGLVCAFSITNAKQHELQFYRGVMGDPVPEVAAKLGILASLITSRIEEAEPEQVEELVAPIDSLRHR